MSDKEMRTRVGPIDKGVQFILLDGVLFRPVDGGWEAYPEDD